MEKRYQVFVSSTYDDLQEERQEVMHALLELDCIPAGMELFPAANEDQWSVIQRVIDDCDYYVVIVAGRYGSIHQASGLGYTEREYRYAIEKGKPSIAFLHRDPGAIPNNRSEQSEEGKRKLAAFRALLEQKVCKYWASPEELGSVVSRSLVQLMKTHPAVGWVKADNIVSENATAEILRLQKQVEELERELKASRTKPPEGTEALAQGDDSYEILYTFRVTSETWDTTVYQARFETTWNDIFAAVSPTMIDEASERTLRAVLNRFVKDNQLGDLKNQKKFAGMSIDDFSIADSAFDTIKVQLRALGLIRRSEKNRSVKDTNTYWTLTPYGDTLMVRLRAIKR
ncbi:MAG: DUF4062 domain-containing protein [Firmicutes bacterium]|nr:DUF4062 domain-containing protein [Bacillota bacterium]